MDATAARRRRFSFGSFVLDEWAAELRKDGLGIPLNATPMRLLQFLLEEHERVVPKEEVLERVWPDASVSDASLASALKEVRQALDDDGARQQWIRTSRGHGYRFIGDVRVELMGPAPAATSEIQELPAPSGRLFVGREAQLHALDLRWRALASSGAQLALLTGPAGIGKTRLALEFESSVRARGGRALFAWCYEGQGAPPYWPWSLLLEAYLRSTPSAEAALGRDRHLLGPLLGERGGASHPDGSSSWSPEDEFRFFYAVAGFFRRAAADRPILATIDDIHWSGRSSLRLLSFLARELYDSPILFVATARDHEPGATPLSDVAGALRHPRGLQLALPVLDERDGARLVEGTLAEDLDPRLIAVLAKRSQGNPLFLSELVSVLQSNPLLRDPEHVHRLVPQGIQDLILSRIAALSPESQALLQFVSLVGHEVPAVLLSHAKLANLGPALSEALAAGVLIALRDDRRSFQVHHPLTAEVVREALSPDQTLELHRRAVAAIERTHADDVDPVAAKLASHYAALARAGGSPEPAVSHARRAGDIALSRLSYDEAADHFRLAIDCLRLGLNHDRRTECELLTRAGDALKRARRAPESRQANSRAIGLAREHHLAELFAEAVLGLAPGFFVSAGWEDLAGRLESPQYDPDLVALLMEALEHLPAESQRLRSLLLSRCAIAKIGGVSEEERARLSQEALDLARRVGDRAALSYAVTARHSTLCRAQDFEDRRDLVEAIPARSAASGDHELFLTERIYSLCVMLEIGDLSGVDREVESCIQHARALRLPRSLRHAYSFRAMRMCITGQFESACEQLSRLIAEAEKDDDSSNLLILRLRLAHAEHEIFRRPGIEAALQAAIRIYPQMRYFPAALARYYLDAAEPQRARLELDRVLKAGIPYNEGWPITTALLAEVATALSDKDLCEEFYELLAPASGRFIVPLPSPSLWASADRLLGGLAHVKGQHEAAVSHFERALALEARIGARPLQARTLYHFALTLAQDGRRRDRARDLVVESRAIADDLRMRTLLSQIEAASRQFPELA